MSERLGVREDVQVSAGDIAAIWQRLVLLPIVRPLLQPCPKLARPRHPVVSDGLDKAGEAKLAAGGRV